MIERICYIDNELEDSIFLFGCVSISQHTVARSSSPLLNNEFRRPGRRRACLFIVLLYLQLHSISLYIFALAFYSLCRQLSYHL